LVLPLLWVSPARATPPTPPAQIILPKELAGDSVQLKEGVLPVQVKQNRPVAAASLVVTQQELLPGKADFEQPRAVPVLEQRELRGKELEAGVRAPLKVDRPGTYRIEIRLSGQISEGSGFSDRLVRYLLVDKNRTATLLTPAAFEKRGGAARQRSFLEAREKNPRSHPIRLLFDDTARVPTQAAASVKPHEVPAERRMIVRPEGPSPFLREHSVERSASSWNSRDNITIQGRLVFQDFDGMWKPLVNVSVNIWDSDFLVDEHLGVVVTDWNGNWSFTCNDDDGWLQDGRDIYYTFKLENTRLSVGDCGFLSGAYEWKSAVHNDLPDGTVLDYGTETAGTHMEAVQVWNTLNLAWNHAVVVGGWDPGKVGGCYPGSSTFYDGNVNVAASDNDGPDSITHEYGHALMAHAYSGGDPSPGGSHGFGDCNQNKSLSWSEGWATGFMLSARPDGTYNWHEGQPGQPIEQFSSTCRLGETSEGWVAAALLDMMDEADDDNGGNLDRGRSDGKDHNAGNTVALATMLRDTMVGGQDSNVLDFWYRLSGELTGTQRALAQEVMYYDWMSVLKPGSACVATKVATQAEKDPEPILLGLRRFRDLALKNWSHGRELINLYYRNSPEIALGLLREPALISDSLRVMRHFSEAGHTIAHHSAYLKAMEEDREVLPGEVSAAASRVLDGLAARASPELKRDLATVRQELAALQGVRVQDLQQRVTRLKASEAERELPGIRQLDYSTGSTEALQDPLLQDFQRKVLPPPGK
jgi:hypothetical protein